MSRNPEGRGSIPRLGSRRSSLISIEHAELLRSTPSLVQCCVWLVTIVVMYALTRLSQHARFRQQQQQQQHALASDIDICSMHAKREDTSEHPVDLSD